MKALIVTFVSLWMGSIPLWTIENQNLSQNRVAIATDDEEEDIPLYVIKKKLRILSPSSNPPPTLPYLIR